MIKVVSIGDIQFEVRPSENQDRYDEFNNAVDKVIEKVYEIDPEYVVLPGDIFQYQDTTADERNLFYKLLDGLCNYKIRIIAGNHDIKQKHNAITKDSIRTNVMDSIEQIVNMLNGSRDIQYFKETGFYQDEHFVWAVWSQHSKFKVNSDELTNTYSPHILEVPNTSKPIIELYHDPIPSCNGWDGKPSDLYGNSTPLQSFKYNTVIAGDIHIPATYEIEKIGDKSRKFNYCSSLVPRNYGECDYYTNNVKRIAGNSLHGFSYFEIDEKGFSDIEFIPIEPLVGRHTIILDKFFMPDSISNLKIDSHQFDYVRIVIESNENNISAYQDELIKHFLDNYNCTVEIKTSYGAIIEYDDVEDLTVAQLADKPTIINIAKNWINDAIDKTRTIAKDQKDEAKRIMENIFKKEFENIELTTNTTHIDILDGNVSNFMTLGDNVQIKYNNNGICKVTGTNGCGKTTLYSFPMWMITDQINIHQNNTKKRENRLLLFNDFRDCDIVEGTLNIKVNGNIWVINKKLTREWKGGKNMSHELNWREYIKGIPKLEIKLTTQNGVFTDTEEVFEMLSSVFNFDDYIRYVFVNQDALNDIVNTNPDTLNEQILRDLGLDFFDRLSERYDIVKDEQLRNLPKHVEDETQILKKIGSFEDSIVNSDENIKSNKKAFDVLNIDKTMLKNKIQYETKKLHNVKSLDEINKEIEILKNNNAAVDENILEINKKITQLEKDINLFNPTEVDSDIISTTKLVNGLDVKISTILAEIEGIKNSHNDMREIAISKMDFIKLQLNNKIDILKTNKKEIINDISLFDIEYSKLDVAVTKAENIKKDEIQKSIDVLIIKSDKITLELSKLTTEQRLLESKIKNNNEAIQKNNTTLEKLKLDSVCPTCHRKYDNIEEAEKHIEYITHENDLLLIDIKVAEIELKELVDSASQLNQQLIGVTTQKSTLNIEKNNIKYTYSDVNGLLEQKTKLDNDVKNKNEQVSQLNIKISNSEKSLIDDINKNQDIKDLNKKLADSKALYVEKQQEHEKLVKDHTTHNTFLTTLDLLKNSIIEKRSTVDGLNVDLQNLKKTRTDNDNNLISQFENVLMSTEDDETNEIISELNKKIEKLDTEMFWYNGQIEKMIMLKKDAVNNIETYKQHIEEIKTWKLNEGIVKQYKTMLSKTGLPKYLFSKITSILNSNLNILLDDLPFKLRFDETNTLTFVDEIVGSIRPVTYTSGMEVTFSGLALRETLRLLNKQKIVNVCQIDEITGKLNDGKELDYSAEDYKKQFSLLLSKIKKSTNIMIIDHVIEDLKEDCVISIMKTPNGSQAEQINM